VLCCVACCLLLVANCLLLVANASLTEESKSLREEKIAGRIRLRLVRRRHMRHMRHVAISQTMCPKWIYMASYPFASTRFCERSRSATITDRPSIRRASPSRKQEPATSYSYEYPAEHSNRQQREATGNIITTSLSSKKKIPRVAVVDPR
jgi:hypothetical protein